MLKYANPQPIEMQTLQIRFFNKSGSAPTPRSRRPSDACWVRTPSRREALPLFTPLFTHTGQLRSGPGQTWATFRPTQAVPTLSPYYSQGPMSLLHPVLSSYTASSTDLPWSHHPLTLLALLLCLYLCLVPAKYCSRNWRLPPGDFDPPGWQFNARG